MANWLPEKWRETLGRLYDDVQRAITRWRRRLTGELAVGGETVALPSWEGWGLPAIEVAESADAVEVTVELPGLSKDDFSLEVVGDYLVLRGEKKREREEKREGYWYSECAYGAFTRWIPLPVPVAAEKAEAKFRHGRLHVRLPKRVPAKKVPVEFK
ncbi:MAG: Hsp20/alpha crystallin family protein [Candidatus Binatia bacterium]|nr:Hsp20/alpha crystallin family protein [Candidatus Binatia bacterium]